MWCGRVIQRGGDCGSVLGPYTAPGRCVPCKGVQLPEVAFRRQDIAEIAVAEPTAARLVECCIRAEKAGMRIVPKRVEDFSLRHNGEVGVR